MTNRSASRARNIGPQAFNQEFAMIYSRPRGASARYFWAGCFIVSAACSVVAETKQWTSSSILGQPGYVQAEFVYDEVPFPSCHASTIVECQGSLTTAWFGGTDERDPDVGIWLSRQHAGQWSSPVEVATGVQSPTERYPTWNPVLFQPASGPLMFLYKVGPIPSQWWGMVMVSEDGGPDLAATATAARRGSWAPSRTSRCNLGGVHPVTVEYRRRRLEGPL